MVKRIDNTLITNYRESYFRPDLLGKPLESVEWYSRKMYNLDNINVENDILKDPFRRRVRTIIGGMFIFRYEPKHAATLKYYDRFPLIFITDRYSDGFLGINLHYLPLKHRSILFNEIMDLQINDRFDYNTRLKATYRTLKSMSRYKYFRPCVKRYLAKNIKSNIIKIPSSEWELALYLPVERFKKATKEEVWSDSRKAIE